MFSLPGEIPATGFGEDGGLVQQAGEIGTYCFLVVVWCIRLVQLVKLVHIGAWWWSGALQPPAAAACCTSLSFTGSEKLSSSKPLQCTSLIDTTNAYVYHQHMCKLHQVPP